MVSNSSQEKILREIDIYSELDAVNSDIAKAEDKLRELVKILNERKKLIAGAVKGYSEEIKWTRFQEEYLPNFIEEPYVIEPSRVGTGGKVIEWHVYVPKMIQFHVGRLERATHSYNVFSVTQYMRHFAEIPEELNERFSKLDLELKVVNGVLITDIDAEVMEQAFQRYREYLYKKEAPGRILIKKGSEWDLIAKILEDGGLPFEPRPIDVEDLRDRTYPKGFAGNVEWGARGYEIEADEKFMEYGAIGIYWPFGTGKSQYGLDLLDRLKGHKLVVVSTRSLVEQWTQRLSRLPPARRSECDIVTYYGRKRIDALIKDVKQFTLVVFDECHHLPAKTFMWLSTIPTKYRLGLTGSPYREDGHINYIMALTGYPLGLAWSQFVAEGIISLAQIQVHVVKNMRNKLALLDDLLKRDLGKTIIFSDSLDIGSAIGKKYGLEWIHGETRKRIDVIKRNERVVVSRVGDEGISIPEIDTIVEVDFLGSSRMQALQRTGRLLHREIQPDKEPAVHHILMTEEELEKYGKRLLGYYDKGFKIDYLYHV